MKHELHTPHLAELAAPLQAPDALPTGIPLEVALIADTPPAQLHVAVASARNEYRDVGFTLVLGTDRHDAAHLEGMEEQARRYNSEVAAIHRDGQAETQRVIGMEASLGYIPPADDLEQLFRDDNAAAEHENADIHNDPAVAAAREDYIQSATDRAIAEAAWADVSATNEIAQGIQGEVIRLSRFKRVATMVAGVALAGLVGLGLGQKTGEEADRASRTTSSQEVAQPQTNTDPTLTITGGAIGAALGAAAGFAAGQRMSGRFARSRARKLVAKARKN